MKTNKIAGLYDWRNLSSHEEKILKHIYKRDVNKLHKLRNIAVLTSFLVILFLFMFNKNIDIVYISIALFLVFNIILNILILPYEQALKALTHNTTYCCSTVLKQKGEPNANARKKKKKNHVNNDISKHFVKFNVHTDNDLAIGSDILIFAWNKNNQKSMAIFDAKIFN